MRRAARSAVRLACASPPMDVTATTIRFETLGCKLNQVESEGAARAFVDAGFPVCMEPVSATSPADGAVALCVVNTCTVTAKAEQKARRLIRLLLAKCPQAAVVVTGCYAQVEGDFLRSLDGRVCVLGGQHKGVLADVPAFLSSRVPTAGAELAGALQAFFDERVKVPAPAFRLSTDTFVHHSRASLKIQDGCNSACTYCRIRLARGRSVSLGVEEAVSQVLALEAAGQTEVVLTTVNIAQYRAPWKGGVADFATLLQEMLSATERIFIRISSLYPEIVDERLAAIIAHPRVQPHFHLSVQSGSDAVLARMKRPYRIASVYRAVELLRQAKQEPFFPGETEADFELTKRLCAECGFTWVHAFPFSPRPGTEAYSMRPMVANNITSERIAWLEDFSRKSKRSYIEGFAGRTLPAVCESLHRARLASERLVAHAVTSNFLHCEIALASAADAPNAGSVVTVRVRRPLQRAAGESDTLAELVGTAPA